MERKKLVEALALVEPSLANNDLIPALTHFWFTGKEVMGYNDVISVVVPCETTFRGSVKGRVLYNFLTKCSGPEVEFKEIKPSKTKSKKDSGDDVNDLEDAPNLQIKCGRASMKMRLFSDDTFLFELPEYEDWPSIDVESKHFLDALDVCLQSLGSHVSEPERNGITVMPQEKGVLHLYSTDSVTLSHAAVTNQVRSDLPDRFVLSFAFCDAARRLLSRSKKKEYQLHLDEDHAVMAFEGGIKLFGRLIEDMSPLDFDDVFSRHLPKRDTNLMIPIPKRLGIVLERAYVAVAKSMTPETRFKVISDSKGTSLRITAASEYGEVRDRVRLSDGDGHPDVSVKVDLKRVRDCGFDVFDNIRITDKCIVLSKGSDMYHLISVLGK